MTYRVPARVLLDDADLVLRQGLAAISAGAREIDLADVITSDSSLIACMLAWRRAAAAAGVTLAIRQPPRRLRGLTALYGVEQIALD